MTALWQDIHYALRVLRKSPGLVLAEAMQLILIGVVLGVAASLALTKVMASPLYGVGATDRLIFLSVTLLLIIVSLAACYVPARRAMRVDPMVALRYE
jgi:putative ABC transport system permease protein